MKKNIVVCLIISLWITACNKDNKNLPENTQVAEETSLSLENESENESENDVEGETTYTNDYFNFSIKIGNEWELQKSTAEEFKSKTSELGVGFLNYNQACGLMVNLIDFYGTNENYTLDEFIKLDQSVNIGYKNRTNISPINKTTLNEIDFRYYTFDIVQEKTAKKAYLYTTNKDKKFYTITLLNVNDENKEEFSKILKTISIKE